MPSATCVGLQRKREQKIDSNTDEEPEYRYSVYVLEASLSFRTGMVIPLMSSFFE
jgi:hypothetical protein